MPVALLQAHGLSKRYRAGVWALSDIDLSLESGGAIGLVGPNGAGKSTLLRTWVGFERPSRGYVRVLGLDPWRERRAVLAHVAYMPQTSALYRDLRVTDHLDYVAHYRGSGFDRHLATQRLSDLGVPLDVTAGSLSGGQAAQVGLAIALGLRADVLILDEPLASLDPLARREFIDVLTDDLASTGGTAVLSSQIVSDIERACSRLVVLAAGHVQLQGSIDAILEDHFVCDEAAAERALLVAGLPDGSQLYRGAADGRPAHSKAASLEDVVLGYLAAGRGSPG